ncbi:hypothetical protein F4Z99_02380 [Candidatus Poribacteria bacterium]|nr:hypothetical protein [Candidatus Poribacteria bacterium]MYB02344.1 hypothetical protein [Candidatus Poribacteria bacterium]
MQRNYPIVIHKDPDTDYCVIVPDLPGCITAGDTLDDAQNQALEAIQCHIEGMLLDGEPVPEAKSIVYHQDNPDYADGTWKSVKITLPDISEIQVRQPNRIQRFFQWFNRTAQSIR